MNVEHNNFIGVYEDVYQQGFCEHLISEFERLETNGVTFNRRQSDNAPAHIKNDVQIFASAANWPFQKFNDQGTHNIFFEGLNKCLQEYCEKYAPLNNVALRCNHMKIQKTLKGGGYHVWHFENECVESAERVLVYSLYLNTLPATAYGETEFLFQHTRVHPKENKLIIWPAGFTHTHRGNPVVEDVAKYIVTGWIYYNG